MIKKLGVLLIVGFFVGLLVNSTFVSQVKLVSANLPTVVHIRNGNRMEAGVFVSSTGDILTCAHGFSNFFTMHPIIIKTSDGEEFQNGAHMVMIDRKRDLAYLTSKPHHYVPYVSVSPYNYTMGEVVYAIGHPFDLGWTISKGVVSARRTYFGHDEIQTDCMVNPGNSGGPVFNRYGRFIGLVEGQEVNPFYTGIGFFITADDCYDFLTEVQYK